MKSALLVLICTVCAHGATHLYVERFATRIGAEKLHDDVIAEVRKLNSVTLVTDESKADLILGGGGEIWVKGYQSLNPRSSRLPSGGTPVYGGYLSVELRSTNGVTLWSYLATPGAESGDVPKDLSKRIAKHLEEGLEQSRQPNWTSPLPQPTILLKGAGATFPFPVYTKWFANYRRENPKVEIQYDAVGSEAGIRRLLDGVVDFGASDSPEILNGDSQYHLFPSVVGAVVPIVNLPGMTQQISLTSEALAGIFLGNIRKWNDPVLQEANRGIRLPDLDIVVVHRSDGSGTSYAWTDYLSKTSPEWKAAAGTGLAPKWPVGRAATGNDGVAKLVKELGGSIGYVEFIYALQNHLSYGKVRNRHGEFVEASLESTAAAIAGSPEMRDDLKASIVDAPGAGAYPIASFTWLVVPGQIANADKRAALTALLHWVYGPGQRQAAALGYLALPRNVAAKAEAAIAAIH